MTGEHDAAWRDPAAVAAQWDLPPGSASPLLRHSVRGAWWETLERCGICLLVSREYEHMLLALAVVDGRPQTTFLRLPHPSGIAVDREHSRVHVAATRNPNQVYTLAPADAEGRPLVPTGSLYYPGRLYLHDLAHVGGWLHGNAVGLNCVVRLSPDGSFEPVWWPRSVDRKGSPDDRHNWLQLNSIAAGKTLAQSFFSASAAVPGHRRPGHRDFPVDRRGVIFSGRTREPVATGLTRPHSARLHESRLWVDDSGYGTVGTVDGGRYLPIAAPGGWTRGLCFHGDVAFVGTSRVLPRFHRYAPGLDPARARCGVHAVDTRTGEVLGSLTWPAGDQIFALDWLPLTATQGLPFRVRPQASRIRDLFYDFRTTPKETAS